MAPITDLPRTNSISEGVRPLSFCFRRQSNNVRYGSLADLDMCPPLPLYLPTVDIRGVGNVWKVPKQTLMRQRHGEPPVALLDAVRLHTDAAARAWLLP